MKLVSGSLRRDFIRYIIPAVVSQWVFALYTMVDGIFVARGVSEEALAAVNISSPFVNGMFALSLTFAVGTSTVVAQYFGRNLVREAKEVFSQTIAVLTVISILITISVMVFLEPFCNFLGASDLTREYVLTYVGTVAPFAAAFILSYTLEILVSTDGYPGIATVVVTLGVVLNCILDYVFIIVMHRGVWGAAFATGVSQAAVIVLYMFHFLGRKGTIKFTRFRFRPRMILREFRNGLPSGVTELSAGIITFVFNQAILRFLNEEALISYSVIGYVNAIVVMTTVGIAQGSQPLVSYYYGRYEIDKCRRLLRYGIVSGAVMSVVIALGCWLGADGIVGIFITSDMAELKAYSVYAFRIFLISFLIVGYNVIIAGYFTSMERPGIAVTISVGRGFVTIIVAMIIVIAVWGGQAIWWAAALSEILCLFLSLILLKRSRI